MQVTGTSRTLTADSQLLQDYLQSTGILLSTEQDSAGAIAAFQNVEGQTEAIVIGQDGCLYHACREPLSDSGWNNYGIGSGFLCLAALDSATSWALGFDGALWRSDHGRWTHRETLPAGRVATAVSVGADGTVWANDGFNTLLVRGLAGTQTPPSISPSIPPVFLRDAANLLNFFCIDQTGALWTVRQAVVGGRWGRWTQLGLAPSEIALKAIAVASNQDGCLQAFAIGSDANVYSIWQLNRDGGWSGWAMLGDCPSAMLAVGTNADGRLEVFVMSPTQNGNAVLSHNWQQGPNGAWYGWSPWDAQPNLSQPPPGVSGLAVTCDQSGCLQLALCGAAITYTLTARQTSAGGLWTDWQRAGSLLFNTACDPCLMVNQDGHLELFVRDDDQNLYHVWQSNGVWGNSWSSLSGPTGPGSLERLVVGQNADGRLEAFGTSLGELYHIAQTTPNGDWSDWNLLTTQAGLNFQTMAVALDVSGALAVVALGANGSWQTFYNPTPLTDTNTPIGWSQWLADWWCWYPIAGAPQLAVSLGQQAVMPSGVGSGFCAIRADGIPVSWNGISWTTLALPASTSGIAVCSAVDNDSTAWILTSDGTLVRMVAGNPEALPGNLPGAVSLGAGAASTIWAVAATDQADPNTFAVYTYHHDGWVAANAPQYLNKDWNNYPQLAVGRDDSVWLLDGSGNAWKQAMSRPGWRWGASPAPACVTFSYLSAARGGAAWAVDTTGMIWQFQGSWSRFNHPLPNAAAVAQVSSGTAGTLWAIDTNRVPYQYGSGAWQSVQMDFSKALVQSPTAWAIEPDIAYQYILQDGTSPGSWTAGANWDTYTAVQISVGSDKSVLLLDSTGHLHAIPGPSAAIPGAPGGLIQIAVVDSSRVWGIVQDADDAFALYLFAEGEWRQVVTSGALLARSAIAPQLSSGGDGTVWLLDTAGIPRRLAWSPADATWMTKGKSTAIQSVTAANVGTTTITTAHVHEAWSVTTHGDIRRSFGNGWTDPYAALPYGASAAKISAGADGSLWVLDTNNVLYKKQACIQDPRPAAGVTAIVAAALDGNGSFNCFSIDVNGQVWTMAQNKDAGTWPDWIQVQASQTFAAIVTGLDQDGTILEVFGLAAGGTPYHAWQTGGSPGWSDFDTLANTPDVALTQLATARDSNDLLYVFGLGADGNVYYTYQTPDEGNGWFDWTAFPAARNFIEIATADAAGAFQVFARDNGGYVYSSYLVASGNWTSWQSLGYPGNVSRIASAVGQDGVLWLFGIGTDNALYAIVDPPTDPSPATTWSCVAAALPGVRLLGLATCTDGDGQLCVFLQGSDGAIYSAQFPSGSDAGVAAITPLGGGGTNGAILQSVVADISDDGVLHVFAAGPDSVWHNLPRVDSPTGWGDWARLSGRQAWTLLGAQPFAQMPVCQVNALWAVFTDGSINTSEDGVAWTAVPFTGEAISVSVGIDGQPWAITAAECYSYEYQTGAWTLCGSSNFVQAPVGTPSDMWSVDPAGAIWRSRDGGQIWWPETTYHGTAVQLSMCADGSIWALDSAGTTSLAAGWQRIMRPTGMTGFSNASGAAQLVAGQDENGTRFLFAMLDGTLNYTYEIAHHAWMQPSTLSITGTAPLVLANQQDTGELIVYQSVAPGGSFGVATKAVGQRFQFSVRNVVCFLDTDWSVPMITTSHEIAAIDADHWFCFAAGWVLRPYYWVGLAVGTISGGQASLAQVNISGLETAVVRILPLPWLRSVVAPFCAIVDPSGDIRIVSTTGEFCTLTGQDTSLPYGGISAVAATLQADSWAPAQPRFYVTASNAATTGLWVLYRTDLFAQPTDFTAWSHWMPLGGNYPSIANGPALRPTDTLFGVSGTGSLEAIRQNPMSGVWTETVVKRPSWSGDDIVPLSMYHTETTVLDGNNIPEANVAVTLFSETPVEAWVNNTLFMLDPVHGVTVRTNSFGKLLIKTIADHLHAPRMSFQVDGLAGAAESAAAGGFGSGGVSVSPSQNVNAFLRGTGQLPVGGGSPTTLSATSIQTLNKSITQANATQLASDISTVANMPGQKLAAQPNPPRPAARMEELGSWFSDAWSDIKHAAESVAHAIENGVVSAAITVGNDTVELKVAIGDEIHTTFDMVINDVEDAARAIEAIVRAYIDDIEEFIEWLALLFDWENILATQRWLRSMSIQMVDTLQDQMSVAETWVSKAFAGINNDVDAAFTSIIGAPGSPGQYATGVSKYQNFNQLPTSNAKSAMATAPRGSAQPATQPIAGSSSVHHNWFFSKVLDHLTPSFSFPSIPGVDTASFLETLDVHATVDQLQAAAKDLKDFLYTLFTDPQALLDQGVVDLVLATKHLLLAVMDLVEALLEAFLKLAKAVIAGLVQMLETPVDIPLISTLFAWVTGEDMTLLNLGTLLTAVPFYLLYEIAFDGRPFPPNSTATALKALELKSLEAPSEIDQPEWGDIYLVLGIINSVVAACSDGITIGQTPAGFTYAAPVAEFLAFFSLVLAVAMQFADWPDENGFPYITPQPPTTALFAEWITWAMYFGPPLLSVPANMETSDSTTDNPQNRLSSTAQYVSNELFGAVALVSAIVSVYSNFKNNDQIENPEDAADLIISPVGLCLNLFLIQSIREAIFDSSEDTIDTAYLIFVVDLLCNLAGSFLDCAATQAPSDS